MTVSGNFVDMLIAAFTSDCFCTLFGAGGVGYGDFGIIMCSFGNNGKFLLNVVNQELFIVSLARKINLNKIRHTAAVVDNHIGVCAETVFADFLDGQGNILI